MIIYWLVLKLSLFKKNIKKKLNEKQIIQLFLLENNGFLEHRCRADIVRNVKGSGLFHGLKPSGYIDQILISSCF